MSMKHCNHSHQTGFTLLEVMISLVIFSIGMLGLAGIQATSIQSNNIAYMRTIAMQSAYDMADIIRANADFNNTVHSNFSNVTTTIPGTAPTACQSDGTAPNCSHADISAFEIYHWKVNLKEQLPSGRGTVVLSGGTYTITVMWDQDRTGATGEDCDASDPATDLKCYVMQTQI